MQQWEQSSKSCVELDPDVQEDYDEMTQQTIVKVRTHTVSKVQ